ncbi:M48 family metalloprotease [Streptomyces sp. enrichment culture]|uniref:M48 family metalloprotease n=1 Tax=Streptomyces sp. enrichment culture TaxID=1795815 RepID=UPI003F57E03A
MRQLHAGQAAVATAIITEAVMTQLRGPAAEIAVSVAVAAGGLWVAQGRARQKSAVAMGATAQALTWQPHAGRRPRPSDGETYRHFAARMRQTTEHVRRTTAERGLEKVTLATSDETGSWADARSTGHGRRGHVWLGMRWLHPRHTAHLPAVLEHELAHLQRRDTGKRIAAESIAMAAVGLAAGLLSLPAFLLTAVAAWMLTILFFWWGELACDLAAVRLCGRTAVADMWREDLERDRARSLLPRIWVTACSLRTHPPMHLRILWAEHVPLPDVLGQEPHPLHTATAG